VSTGEQTTDAPHWPLVRVTSLGDMLNQAKDQSELCKWFFNHAESGQYEMYLPVPKGYFARCSSHHSFDFGLGASTRHGVRPPLPEIGIPLLEVKFVRLSHLFAKKVAQQAASKSMFQPSHMRNDRFRGGLSLRDHFSDALGSYEELPVAVELRIASASLETTNAWERMEIDPTQVVIGDSVYDHIRPLLKGASNTAIDVDATLSIPASAAPSHEGHELSAAVSTVNDTPSTAARVAPLADAIDTNDPYDLRVRAPAVYALYRTAELCHQKPDYQLGLSTKGQRKEIAKAVLEHLAETSPRLLNVFQTTRRNYVATLIDPQRDPNEGQPPEKQREWPTQAAAMLLEQVDARRQTFVYPTLELVIHAAEQWLAWKVSTPKGKTPLSELDGWLAKHGLTGAQERATLFPVITFDGIKLRQAPKSATPSISRARAKAGRRASR